MNSPCTTPLLWTHQMGPRPEVPHFSRGQSPPIDRGDPQEKGERTGAHWNIKYQILERGEGSKHWICHSLATNFRFHSFRSRVREPSESSSSSRPSPTQNNHKVLSTSPCGPWLRLAPRSRQFRNSLFDHLRSCWRLELLDFGTLGRGQRRSSSAHRPGPFDQPGAPACFKSVPKCQEQFPAGATANSSLRGAGEITSAICTGGTFSDKGT